MSHATGVRLTYCTPTHGWLVSYHRILEHQANQKAAQSAVKHPNMTTALALSIYVMSSETFDSYLDHTTLILSQRLSYCYVTTSNWRCSVFIALLCSQCNRNYSHNGLERFCGHFCKIFFIAPLDKTILAEKYSFIEIGHLKKTRILISSEWNNTRNWLVENTNFYSDIIDIGNIFS